MEEKQFRIDYLERVNREKEQQLTKLEMEIFEREQQKRIEV